MKHFENLKDNGYTILNNFMTNKQVIEFRDELQSVIRVVGDKTSGPPIGEQSKIKQDLTSRANTLKTRNSDANL